MLGGEGDQKKRLFDLAKDLNIADRVHIIGGLSNKEIPIALQQADMFAQPSIGEEAFGITLAEAMSSGLPIIASRNGGIVEFVKDGKTGVLVETGNIFNWRRAIERLSQDRSYRDQLGKNARDYIQQHLTWDAKARDIMSIVQL